MRILFLTQWYPNRYDAMAGLFVRKHAAAVARRGQDVCVLYFHPDRHIRGVEIEEQTTDGVKEICIYHSGSFVRAMQLGYKELTKRWGLPDLSQVNVLSKNALFARYLERRHHIPYVLLEHWSGYLPANGAYLRSNPIKRHLMEKLARRAACIMPVSNVLMQAMQQCGIQGKRWLTVHNVVDDFFYAPVAEQEPHRVFRLLHVSCFDEKAKNVCGIFRAIKALSLKRSDFRLDVIGTGVDFEDDKKLADELQLTDRFVFFHGEKTPEEVHKAMIGADAFVLFSHYETAGVVLAECLAAGLPIVASRAGAIPEIVSEDTGLLVAPANDHALTEALAQMIECPTRFDKNKIKEKGSVYTYEAVGKQLCEVYASVLS